MNAKEVLPVTMHRFMGLVAPMLLALSLSAHGGQGEDFLVTEKVYALPDVALVDSAGQPVRFSTITGDARRTVISFIFTSCAGICPMITANMARAIPALDELESDYQILLISVDPEYDTPARLAEYADRFNAGEKIRFLTGTRDNVFSVLRSLEALYEGSNKMNHQPVTLISGAEHGGWTRIDGLIGSEVLIEQYRKVLTRQAG
ncbi:MAG TPA: SCO family protein [Wenzhouxiangellaceae bacterium]|nr:SCO family protein [Wenzhouxiangellaceae bacterium]